MAKHKTWQSIKHGKALAAHSAENQHSPLNTENTPQHGTLHNSSPQSKHHTADFRAGRAEHGHTEQSLAHATVHEHKHTVETSLEQNRIAEHTSQSRAQDSSTHRRAQLAHTPQSAISSQLGSKSRRQQEPGSTTGRSTQHCNARSRADITRQSSCPGRNTKQHTTRTAHSSKE